MSSLLSNFYKNTKLVFAGKNLLWHLLAIVLTFVLVVSGADWAYYVATRGETANMLGMISGITGFFLPFLLPLMLYLVGKYRGNDKMMNAGKYAFVAVLVAWFVIAFYKALSGRLPPDVATQSILEDISREWNFGFFRNGIFWGWPSHHTGVAFALSVFLSLWYKNKKWFVILMMSIAFIVGIGASVVFHWLSEAVAGLIIGSLVGYVVYKNSSPEAVVVVKY